MEQEITVNAEAWYETEALKYLAYAFISGAQSVSFEKVDGCECMTIYKSLNGEYKIWIQDSYNPMLVASVAKFMGKNRYTFVKLKELAKE